MTGQVKLTKAKGNVQARRGYFGVKNAQKQRKGIPRNRVP